MSQLLKVPSTFVWGTAFISFFPAALLLLGISFDTSSQLIDIEPLLNASLTEIKEAIYPSFAGSFTHTILEWASISIAVLTVFVAFAHFKIKRDAVTPIIGVALFTAGLMDAFHALAADRLISAAAPNEYFVPFTWAIARLFNASITMAGVCLLLIYGNKKAKLSFVFSVTVIFGLVAYAIMAFCATQPTLPQTIYPDAFISRPWDIGPLVLYFVCGLWLYPKFYKRQPSLFTQALWISLIPQIMTELHMAFGSTGLYDSHFNIAHFLKIVAYAVPFIGLLLDYIKTYQSKQRLEQALLAEKNNLETMVRGRTLELEKSEAMTKSIIETALDAIILIDRNARIITWNKHANLTYGWTEQEVLGKPITDIFELDNDTYNYTSELETLLTTGVNPLKNKRLEVIAHSKHGQAFPIELTFSPILQGNDYVFSTISRDISARKQGEDELKAARESAVKANSIKSEFLANMSHEIRTPMNAIIGMSDLALETKLDSKQHNYVYNINRSANSLLGIINDILDFSKIEAGKLYMESIPFRIEDVLDELAAMLSFKAEKKSVELLFDIPPALPEGLIGDPLRLNQVLINLGDNAIKFTEVGEVIISVRLIEQAKGWCRLKFSVKDSGIGIDKQKIDSLFNSFTQADTSTTREFGGTGLGLTISRKIAEIMDGELTCESELSKGSTFSFTAKFQQDEVQESSSTTSYPSYKVLIVDDNQSSRDILNNILTSFGMSCEQAENGSLALEKIKTADSNSAPYELIIIDWQMPEIDGIEVVKRIQTLDIVSAPPAVVMVTAHGKQKAQEAASGTPIKSFLTKPVTPSTLLDSILVEKGKEILHQNRAAVREEEVEKAIDGLRGARILLVEDNAINLELAVDVLNRQDIDVVTAKNGVEAIRQLEEQVFDGVLMDCQMPIMDGYEATRNIRNNENFKQLPILAMTANAMAGDKEKVLEAGMNDHITKPINRRRLFLTMAKWIKPAQPLLKKAPKEKIEDPVSIPDIKGINLQAGLAICNDSPSLYLSLLKNLVEQESDFKARFQHHLANRNIKSATLCVHTLKGVSGNLAAEEVYQAAFELEEACQQGNYELIHERAKPVFGLLEDLLSNIKVAIEGLAIEKPNLPADKDLCELLRSILVLLESSDTEAIEQIENISITQHSDEIEKLLNELRNAADNYDFNQAMASCQKLLSTLDCQMDGDDTNA